MIPLNLSKWTYIPDKNLENNDKTSNLEEISENIEELRSLINQDQDIPLLEEHHNAYLIIEDLIKQPKEDAVIKKIIEVAQLAVSSNKNTTETIKNFILNLSNLISASYNSDEISYIMSSIDNFYKNLMQSKQSQSIANTTSSTYNQNTNSVLSNSCQLFTLPIELQFNIFQYLTPDDIFISSLVNKEWKKNIKIILANPPINIFSHILKNGVKARSENFIYLKSLLNLNSNLHQFVQAADISSKIKLVKDRESTGYLPFEIQEIYELLLDDCLNAEKTDKILDHIVQISERMLEDGIDIDHDCIKIYARYLERLLQSKKYDIHDIMNIILKIDIMVVGSDDYIQQILSDLALNCVKNLDIDIAIPLFLSDILKDAATGEWDEDYFHLKMAMACLDYRDDVTNAIKFFSLYPSSNFNDLNDLAKQIIDHVQDVRSIANGISFLSNLNHEALNPGTTHMFSTSLRIKFIQKLIKRSLEVVNIISSEDRSLKSFPFFSKMLEVISISAYVFKKTNSISIFKFFIENRMNLSPIYFQDLHLNYILRTYKSVTDPQKKEVLIISLLGIMMLHAFLQSAGIKKFLTYVDQISDDQQRKSILLMAFLLLSKNKTHPSLREEWPEFRKKVLSFITEDILQSEADKDFFINIFNTFFDDADRTMLSGTIKAVLESRQVSKSEYRQKRSFPDFLDNCEDDSQPPLKREKK